MLKKIAVYLIKWFLLTIVYTIWSIIGSVLILIGLQKMCELWDKLKVKFKEWIKKEIKEALAE